MDTKHLLLEAFGRIPERARDVVAGLTADQLCARVDGRANSIAWLVWHLARVQDDHVSDVAGAEQTWTADGWAERFGLPLDPADTGFGHTDEQVSAVRVDDPDQLTGYLDAVHARTVAFVSGLSDADLDRVVDTRWDPPVTLGVRLVSVIDDDLEHLGQAAFSKGLL
ncbi:MAG: mycothiol transferase [Angustibacter sp.]